MRLEREWKIVPRGIVSSAHIRTASNMDRVLDKGGGLDIHKKSVAAAIAIEDGSILEAEFGMTTDQIYNLKKWLLENGCKRVLVESTASYWYRIDQILRDEVNVIVVNPRGSSLFCVGGLDVLSLIANFSQWHNPHSLHLANHISLSIASYQTHGRPMSRQEPRSVS